MVWGRRTAEPGRTGERNGAPGGVGGGLSRGSERADARARSVCLGGNPEYLGKALTDLGEREGGAERLEQALAAFHEALKEWTPEGAPHYHQMALSNLERAEQLLPPAGITPRPDPPAFRQAAASSAPPPASCTPPPPARCAAQRGEGRRGRLASAGGTSLRSPTNAAATLSLFSGSRAMASLSQWMCPSLPRRGKRRRKCASIAPASKKDGPNSSRYPITRFACEGRSCPDDTRRMLSTSGWPGSWNSARYSDSARRSA